MLWQYAIGRPEDVPKQEHKELTTGLENLSDVELRERLRMLAEAAGFQIVDTEQAAKCAFKLLEPGEDASPQEVE